MAATAQDQKMYVGIDVSKNRLDVHIQPSAEVFAVGQNAEGLEQLVKHLKDLDLAVIAIEATGGFESMAAAALAAATLPVVVVNPRAGSQLCQGLGGERQDRSTRCLRHCPLCRGFKTCDQSFARCRYPCFG